MQMLFVDSRINQNSRQNIIVIAKRLNFANDWVWNVIQYEYSNLKTTIIAQSQCLQLHLFRNNAW